MHLPIQQPPLSRRHHARYIGTNVMGCLVRGMGVPNYKSFSTGHYSIANCRRTWQKRTLWLQGCIKQLLIRQSPLSMAHKARCMGTSRLGCDVRGIGEPNYKEYSTKH